MKTHRKKSAKVPASATGAGDLLTSDAVRGGSLVGRPITPMGCEPAVVSGRPATHPVELRARIDRGHFCGYFFSDDMRDCSDRHFRRGTRRFGFMAGHSLH